MTQRLNILFCLFLAACSANETKETIAPVLEASKEQSLGQNHTVGSNELNTEIITAPPKPIDNPALQEPKYVYEDRPLPSLTALPAVNKIFPNLILGQVTHKPSDIKITTQQDACKIERAPKLPMPSTLKFSHTSPDKTNALYVDEGFKGVDHDVLDSLSAVIDGKGRQAMIVTPSESILMTVKTDYGIGFQYSQGKLSCSIGHGIYAVKQFGFITYYTHDVDLQSKTETLSLRGRKRDECLTLIDKDNTEFVAVLPRPHDADYMYRLLRETGTREPVFTRLSWLPPQHQITQGVKTSLTSPLNNCENISNAILLKHSPVISTYGITFPSN